MAQANNSFVISGNLVRDPEIKLTVTQTMYCFISLAVRGMSKDKVDFISVVLWRNLAVNIKQYCHKGDTLTICGHITTFKRDDKTELQLVADGFTILASKKHAEASTPEAPIVEKPAEVLTTEAPTPEAPAEAPAPEAPASTTTEAPAKAPTYGDVFAEMSEPFTPFS